MTDRYGLYLAPRSETALWRFGSAVLGYDAQSGAEPAQLVPDGVSAERFNALTQAPRLYGFHATLKAPFRLAEGRCEADLRARLAAFCASWRPFALERLTVGALGTDEDAGAFIALVEPAATPALLDLERQAVEAFEPFRAPLEPDEIARRRPERLSPRQRDYLHRYGYPNVLEEFRFHMTLTGRVPGPEGQGLRQALERMRAGFGAQEGLFVDHVCIVRQRPGERFRIIERTPFAGNTR